VNERSNRCERHTSLALLLIPLVLFLAACDDPAAPDYRYRLTVEVETPEGLKTGSSVIEVEQTLGRAGASPANSQIYRKARGEAVAVDLPGGQTLFALLRSESDIEWAETVAARVAAMSGRGSSPGRFDAALNLVGPAEVPRTFPAYKFIEKRSAYPMLVTFGDIDDPTSVERVDPDDLAASFGEGVKLKRITVQLTDDPVTTGIEGRFGWWDRIEDSGGGLVPMTKNDRGRWEVALGFDEGLVDVGLSNFSTEAFKQ